MGYGGDVGQGQDGSAYIRSISEHNKPGVGLKCCLQVLGIYISLAVAGDNGNFNLAFLFQSAQRPDDGVVFHTGGYDMIERSQQSLQSQIEGVGDVGGKDNMVFRGGIKKVMDGFPCLKHNAPGFQAKVVAAAPGAGPYVAQVIHHGLPNSFRLCIGGSSVIQEHLRTFMLFPL